jgi:hypothetical protein
MDRGASHMSILPTILERREQRLRASYRPGDVPMLNALVQWMRDIIAGSRDGLAMQDRYEAL